MHCLSQAGDASGTGLFDTANRKYDPSRMSSIDSELHSFFPELIGPDEVFALFSSIPLSSPLISLLG